MLQRPGSGGDWQPADRGSLLSVATEVTQVANNKEQVVPTIEKLHSLPEWLGRAEVILADSGYLSQTIVGRCEAAIIERWIVTGRCHHHVTWKRRFAASPKSPPYSPTVIERMAYRLLKPGGKVLCALHKQAPEPVFGIVNQRWIIANVCREGSKTSRASGIYRRRAGTSSECSRCRIAQAASRSLGPTISITIDMKFLFLFDSPLTPIVNPTGR